MRRLVTVLAGVVVISSLAPAAAASETRGSFVIGCDWSHSLADDPIVSPGTAGASHLHDFFGNVTAKATSTTERMLLGSTSCRDRDDTAGYWSPTGYLDGAQITPLRQRIYYFGKAKGSVETIPADLKVVAGNKHAASPADNPNVAWNCGGQTTLSSHPYDCRPYQGTSTNVDGVVGHVDLPECWDGAHLDSTDHMSHMAYNVQGEGCPATHPHRIPQLRIRVHFGIWDPCLGAAPCGPNDPDTNVKLALSSGPYYTLHADFWNTWKQGALDYLVANCLNAHIVCAAPSALTPGSPTLSASAGSGTVHLSWTVPSGSGITNYNVYRATTSGEEETPLASVGNVTSYDDAAVTNGVTYYYLVAAVNTYGPGLPSGEASATPGAPAPNTPPTASFTFGCSGLTCSFSDTSTDPDGTVAAWRWDFGDTGTETAQNPSHTYALAGTYTVSLTVTDNMGATGSTSQDVTVNAPSGGISLSATGYKVRGLQKVDLSWIPSDPATNVNVLRNGTVIVTTPNDGAYTDNIDKKGSGTYVYRVCVAGTSTCSNEATVVF